MPKNSKINFHAYQVKIIFLSTGKPVKSTDINSWTQIDFEKEIIWSQQKKDYRFSRRYRTTIVVQEDWKGGVKEWNPHKKYLKIIVR
jgi:NMD protein affecting ribosome stability and mRNA decay